MIVAIRLLHGIITAFFLTCIVYIFYTGITGSVTIFSFLAIVSILIEGLVVFLNNGVCPLGVIHHRVGDDKTFFELFLPKPIAKKAIPLLGSISVIGMLLVVYRYFFT